MRISIGEEWEREEGGKGGKGTYDEVLSRDADVAY